MSYIYKRMTADEFAEYLLTLKAGQLIEFATKIEGEMVERLESDENMAYDCDTPLYDWYFATRIVMDEYRSDFILIDFTAGGEALAIPRLNYRAVEPDEDERRIAHERVRDFFRNNTQEIHLDAVYVGIRKEDD